MTEASQLPEPDDRFGDCPECGGNDWCLNVGKDHWIICHRHKTKWFRGANLFSFWRHESEELWEENAKLLAGYREVEPWNRNSPQEAPKPPRVPAKDNIEDDAPRRRGDIIEIRIECHPDLLYLHEDCVFCGGMSSKRAAVPIAELPTGPAEVCYECIAAGPEEMKGRMRAQAQRLRAWAAEFERLAQSAIKAPSIEDVKETERLGDLEFYSDLEEPW